jgi:hypothetical protein
MPETDSEHKEYYEVVGDRERLIPVCVTSNRHFNSNCSLVLEGERLYDLVNEALFIVLLSVVIRNGQLKVKMESKLLQLLQFLF